MSHSTLCKFLHPRSIGKALCTAYKGFLAPAPLPVRQVELVVGAMTTALARRYSTARISHLQSYYFNRRPFYPVRQSTTLTGLSFVLNSFPGSLFNIDSTLSTSCSITGIRKRNLR